MTWILVGLMGLLFRTDQVQYLGRLEQRLIVLLVATHQVHCVF